MSKDDLDKRVKISILRIAAEVRDINHKLTHFLENYREDYYNAISEESYEAR